MSTVLPDQHEGIRTYQVWLELLTTLSKIPVSSNRITGLQERTQNVVEIIHHTQLTVHACAQYALIPHSEHNVPNKWASRIHMGYGILTIMASIVALVESFIQNYAYNYASRQALRDLSYQDFLHHYTDIVRVWYHIQIFDLLIQMSYLGSFPEQIFARIHLATWTLPGKYRRHMNKCAKKMIKLSFTNSGKFIWKYLEKESHPYKKFVRKVPHDWRQLVQELYFDSWKEQDQYYSDYTYVLLDEYNVALLHMIDAGMNADKTTLLKIYQSGSDSFIEQLFQYYQS